MFPDHGGVRRPVLPGPDPTERLASPDAGAGRGCGAGEEQQDQGAVLRIRGSGTWKGMRIGLCVFLLRL